MWLPANVVFSVDIFCFDKSIFRFMLKDSANSEINPDSTTGKCEKEPKKDRPIQRRIHNQTRNERTTDRSLPNHRKNATENRGGV
jgi:hypothetical protein